MDEQNSKFQLDILKEKINFHNYRYHVLDAPVISDYEYDQMVNELLEMESKHPEWVTPDSPSQRAGSTPSKKFTKIRHPRHILSLANAYTDAGVYEWLERIRKLDSRIDNSEYIVEPKIDGLTVVLHYQDGIFVQGATRGDGIVGEDITNNLKTVRSLPLKIPVDSRGPIPPYEFVVRGEAFISLDNFEKLNKKLEKSGEATYQNPRNTAAGALRQLDPKLTAKRPLAIMVYAILSEYNSQPITEKEQLHYLTELGFTVPESIECTNIKEAVAAYNQLLSNRDKLFYEADGAVIKLNNLRLAEGLGIVGKDPRGAIAFKFPAREATTKLLDIVVNVGRTGVLTPLALLDPIEVGGVIVKQATLHNFDFIEDKDIRIGDRIAIKRAGDVIPYVIGPLIDIRTGTERIYVPPVLCPECHQKVEHIEGEVAWYCVNVSCPAQLIRNIEHFASRGAMDISGLGIKIIELIVTSGLVSDVSDIYLLKRNDLLKLEGFAEKKADNLISAINLSRNRELNRLILALGIRGVGEVLANELIHYYYDLDKFSNTTVTGLQNIEGVGPNIARSIVDWFDRPANKILLEKLKQVGVWPAVTSLQDRQKKLRQLDDKIFVFTGTIPGYTRNELKEWIEGKGGKVADTVSKNTSYIIVGDQPGSKLDKANRLNIRVIDIKDLEKLIDEG
jgi:DNA ligase (NAD+)